MTIDIIKLFSSKISDVLNLRSPILLSVILEDNVVLFYFAQLRVNFIAVLK